MRLTPLLLAACWLVCPVWAQVVPEGAVERTAEPNAGHTGQVNNAETTEANTNDVRPVQPDAQGVVRLDNVEVDLKNQQVRFPAESLAVEMPLEFVAVVNGGPEHEALFRTDARPSTIHTGLLMLGLEPGQPLKMSPNAGRWVAPFGPPVRVSFEWTDNGQTRRQPVSRFVRSARTQQPMPEQVFVFTGSVVDENKRYLADVAGYVVSLVNFELTMIDVPRLASSANETLEWEFNPQTGPARGVKGALIIEPAGQGALANDQPPEGGKPAVNIVKLSADGSISLNGRDIASTQELVELLTKQSVGGPPEKPGEVRIAADPDGDSNALLAVIQSLAQAGIPVKLGTPARLSANLPDTADLNQLRERWQQAVNPHAQAMRDAAATHYQVIAELRERQQKLIDESDRIQRLIEELERDYADMTTPRPK